MDAADARQADGPGRTAPRERLIARPATKEPRSSIRTTDRAPRIRARVPKARMRCGAVRPSGENRSPFAVRWPEPFQEAVSARAHGADPASTRHARAARAGKRRSMTGS
ncbi:hypothetical protein ASG32_02690 [Methylobacterium sp. Leaf361]|nr:hypothetical protein ASG32_02690 [Methylobacterium sp. Leaf361]